MRWSRIALWSTSLEVERRDEERRLADPVETAPSAFTNIRTTSMSVAHAEPAETHVQILDGPAADELQGEQ